MERRFQIVGNERYRFCVPVEIDWLDAQGRPCQTTGQSMDASVYGLGVFVPVSLEVGTDVTVCLRGVRLCSTAQVQHVQPDGGGFRIGLQFELTLYMQGIPELDKLLRLSLRSARGTEKWTLVARLQQIGLRLLRRTLRKRLPPDSAVSPTNPSHSAPR